MATASSVGPNNNYRITRRIGGGSFGEIYLGIGPSGEKVMKYSSLISILTIIYSYLLIFYFIFYFIHIGCS